MKSIILTIALATLTLSGCKTSTEATAVLNELRYEISWKAFCDARGYDLNDHSYLTENEYLDTWSGSVDEEEAFIKAGVEPY